MIPISGCFVHAPLQVFTSALYNLAANPQFTQPLREEVEAIVEREGWSRTSLSKMRKVDSFLKETVRMEGIEICQSFPFFYCTHHAVNLFLFPFFSGFDAQGHKGLYLLRRDVYPKRDEDPCRPYSLAS